LQGNGVAVALWARPTISPSAAQDAFGRLLRRQGLRYRGGSLLAGGSAVNCTDRFDTTPGQSAALSNAISFAASNWASGTAEVPRNSLTTLAQNWMYSRFRRFDHSTGGLVATDLTLLILSASLISFAEWLFWLVVAICAALHSRRGSDLSPVTSRAISVTGSPNRSAMISREIF
jgi:hypothetical protein